MKYTTKNILLRPGVILLALFLAVSVFLTTTALAQEEVLTITDVQVLDIDAENKSATLTWKTNLLSQSIVVCGNSTQAPFEFDVASENFGYTWSTTILGGVTLDHRVPLAQLASETHFCRVASRVNTTSPWVVSEEITFTTGDTVTEQTVTVPLETWEGDIDRGEEAETTEADASVGVFGKGECSEDWSIWVLVLITLLIATLWPKEMMEKLTTNDSVRRLYVLGSLGLIVFLIALLNDAGNWIVPVGIGTMAIIAATIVDVVRAESASAHERLRKIITTLLVASLLAFILAIILSWTCAITPIAALAVVLGIRHYMFNKEETKGVESEEKRIIKTESKEEEEKEKDEDAEDKKTKQDS